MYSKEIEVVLPMPPSTNVLFAGRARRFKSKKYKEWEDMAKEVWDEQYSHLSMNPDTWKHTIISLETPLYYKNGGIKRIDCANYEKAVIDFITNRLGFDDKMFLRNTQEKKRGTWNEATVKIWDVE